MSAPDVYCRKEYCCDGDLLVCYTAESAVDANNATVRLKLRCPWHACHHDNGTCNYSRSVKLSVAASEDCRAKACRDLLKRHKCKQPAAALAAQPTRAPAVVDSMDVAQLPLTSVPMARAADDPARRSPPQQQAVKIEELDDPAPPERAAAQSVPVLAGATMNDGARLLEVASPPGEARMLEKTLRAKGERFIAMLTNFKGKGKSWDATKMQRLWALREAVMRVEARVGEVAPGELHLEIKEQEDSLEVLKPIRVKVTVNGAVTGIPWPPTERRGAAAGARPARTLSTKDLQLVGTLLKHRVVAD
jgi:hypothetical protein